MKLKKKKKFCFHEFIQPPAQYIILSSILTYSISDDVISTGVSFELSSDTTDSTILSIGGPILTIAKSSKGLSSTSSNKVMPFIDL